MTISEQIARLEHENLQLKWVVAQFMQRFNLEESTFMKKNPSKFGISVQEDRDKVGIKLKRIRDVSDTDRQSNLT